jgi:uncharacterized membrane protein YfcA
MFHDPTLGRYMQNGILFVVLGVIAGTLSGLIGIGGGVIIIPVLVFLFGFSQQQAQGTTLALLVPPIGILAAWTYYKAGFVDLKAAGFICIGFVAGSLLGAKIATGLTSQQLERIFGVVLLLISVKMIVGR